MAPFYVEPIKSLSARVENDSEPIDPQTTMDPQITMKVVIVLGKFASIEIIFKYFHFPWFRLSQADPRLNPHHDICANPSLRAHT